MAIVGKRVYYSGRVQGVGFRYTARYLAQGFAVAGFVRNLPDGRVEMVVEGPADHVEAFLDAVATRLSFHIQDTDVRTIPPEGHRGFHVST